LAKKKRAPKRPANAEKQAAKAARRKERQAAELKAQQDVQRKRRVKVIAGSAISLLAVIAMIFAMIPGSLDGVSKDPLESSSHLAAGETVTYSTPTPTSGRHTPGSPSCGVLTEQLPPELAIHTLEHGGVVIWYQPTLEAEVVAGLASMVNAFDDRVILSPNAELEDPVVVTSWRHLKAYDGADPEIEEFIDIYRFRAPENVPCTY
jgi:hypothetical protein